MRLLKTYRSMGFRDLSCFNKALLAKQIWCMWKAPYSLITKIMKAKYHMGCSILDASLGRKPSFAWRNIYNSIDRLVWKIENEKTIRIWEDRWLPNPSTFKVLSPPQVLEPTTTVSQLIDGERKWGNQNLLEQLFSKGEGGLMQYFQSLEAIWIRGIHLFGGEQQNGFFRWRVHITFKRNVKWFMWRKGIRFVCCSFFFFFFFFFEKACMM